MEALPRSNCGDDVQRCARLRDDNVLTEVKIALTQAHDWVDVVVAFDDFATAARFADAGLPGRAAQKLVAMIARRSAALPAPDRRFGGAAVVLTMIAGRMERSHRCWADGRTIVHRAGQHAAGRQRRSRRSALRALLPIYEYAWNHTTLHALKVDRNITYHQTLYPAPDHVEKAIALHRQLQGDVLHHLEFVRFEGKIACYVLPLIAYTTPNRLR
jgi:hypothetical protein